MSSAALFSCWLLAEFRSIISHPTITMYTNLWSLTSFSHSSLFPFPVISSLESGVPVTQTQCLHSLSMSTPYVQQQGHTISTSTAASSAAPPAWECAQRSLHAQKLGHSWVCCTAHACHLPHLSCATTWGPRAECLVEVYPLSGQS